MKTIASRISPVLSGYRFHFLLLFCLIGYSSKPSCLYGQEAPKMIIKGTITEAGSGEAIYGATVYHPASKRGTAANEYGFFSLQVDQAQNHQLRFSAMGYRDTLLAASCQARTCEVSIVLTPTSALLETVTVSANSELSSQQFRNGVTTLSALDIQRTPVLLGEKDILKSLQLLPGVSNPREGFGGLFVRGGSPDQNLILLDDAPVYNAFHLFGFLSVFNPDAVRHVALHKGVFPARYGGRLSSVLDLRMKEGNREGFHGSGGIGLIAARVNLEGPIGKSKKFSYLLSGRRSYVDLLLGLLGDESEKNVIAFHDGNAKINFKPDDRNTFFLSSYTGRDRFVFANNFDDQQLEDGFSWGNTTFTLRWAHQLSDQAFLKTTLLRSDFNFEQYTEDIQDGIRFANRVENGIRNLGAKMDLDLALTSEHQLKAGAAVTEHTFISAVAALQEVSLDSFALATPQNTAQEYAVYLEDSWSITPNWRVNLGLRWNGFATEDQFYQNIEPRIFSQWQLGKTTALRAGYLRSNQYLHLLSNSGAGLPTDLWVATDDNIQPQRGWQVTGGWV
ncbi:MAG: TonB-dependent receptor, partial [Bacteroidota bacterium]